MENNIRSIFCHHRNLENKIIYDFWKTLNHFIYHLQYGRVETSPGAVYGPNGPNGPQRLPTAPNGPQQKKFKKI